MGGKGGSPPPPDYTPIAGGQIESAQIAAQVAREQLQWAKEQYAQDRQINDKVIDRALRISEDEAKAGKETRDRYNTAFRPVEDDLLAEYRSYNTDAKRDELAGRATATVGAQFDAARQAAVRDLESYGVDPSQTRSGALDLGVRVAQAAATAGAANTARLQAEDQRRALRSEAINLGSGQGSQIASAYGTAMAAGNQAVNAGLATTASGASTMGTGLQWNGASQNGYAGAAQTYSYQGQQQQQQAAQRAQQSAGLASGIGSLAGAVIGTMVAPGVGTALGASLGGAAGGALGGSGRKYAEGGRVTAITPDMSPSGGAQTDDVAIKVDEGEMVVPADVSRWYGEKFFHDLAIKARKAQGVENPKGLGPPGGAPATAIPMGA